MFISFPGKTKEEVFAEYYEFYVKPYHRYVSKLFDEEEYCFDNQFGMVTSYSKTYKSNGETVTAKYTVTYSTAA